MSISISEVLSVPKLGAETSKNQKSAVGPNGGLFNEKMEDSNVMDATKKQIEVNGKVHSNVNEKKLDALLPVSDGVKELPEIFKREREMMLLSEVAKIELNGLKAEGFQNMNLDEMEYISRRLAELLKKLEETVDIFKDENLDITENFAEVKSLLLEMRSSLTKISVPEVGEAGVSELKAIVDMIEQTNVFKEKRGSSVDFSTLGLGVRGVGKELEGLGKMGLSEVNREFKELLRDLKKNDGSAINKEKILELLLQAKSKVDELGKGIQYSKEQIISSKIIISGDMAEMGKTTSTLDASIANEVRPTSSVGKYDPLNLQDLKEQAKSKMEEIQKMVVKKDMMLVQLKPESLGKLDMFFKKVADGIEISIDIEKASSKLKVEVLLDELRKDFKDRGLEVDYEFKQNKDEKQNREKESERKNGFQHEDGNEDSEGESFENVMKNIMEEV